ncbi:MAG: adenylate/guanylate cyclase domain-containing protein [Rhodospirillales bacterium]
MDVRFLNDADRVAALRSYNILDTAPELAYEEITRLAAHVSECPVATVGFIDDRRHWAKSRCGLPRGERPRELSICSATVSQANLLVVPDLAADERFATNPFVAGEPYFRFYCGMPLINREGFALGTLCVMDFRPRDMKFEQTEAIRCLAHQVMTQLELRRKLTELEEAHRRIEAEKSEAERLLLNILPKSVAEELKRRGHVQPRYYDSATVLFADFSGFTRLAESMEPSRLIQQLDDYFSRFDEIVERHGLEKIKTIGDGYMAVGGVPEPNHTHAVDAALAGLEMREHLRMMNRERAKLHLTPWQLRIGVHTGPVIAGVVGSSKFAYDIWGDTVNVAARMESGCQVGTITLSEYTYNLLRNLFDMSPCGSFAAKNKGSLQAYTLERIKPAFSSDAEGMRPNSEFTQLAG